MQNSTHKLHPPTPVSHSPMQKGATFDTTGQYRYMLWREWDLQAPGIGFVMLNPNRADAVIDDPTIRRCVGFAKAWGYGRLEVMNLFAYRTAQPQELRQVSDPIGVENDAYLISLSDRVERIVFAWGNWGTLGDRAKTVLQLLAHSPHLYCFGLTKTGQPKHPLYLRKDTHCCPFEHPFLIKAPLQSQ